MKLKFYLRGLGIGMVVTALLMGFATKDKGELSDAEIKARAKELGMVEQRTLADIRDNAVATEIPAVTETPDDTTRTPMPETPDDTAGASGESAEVTATEAPEETQTQEPDVADPEKEDVGPETEETIEAGEPEQTKEPEEPNQTQAPENQDETEPSGESDTSEESTHADSRIEENPPIAEVYEDMVKITIYEGNYSLSVCELLEEVGLVEDALAFDLYLQYNGYSKRVNTGSYKIAYGTSEEEIARIITNTN